jgi:hypothetical protein
MRPLARCRRDECDSGWFPEAIVDFDEFVRVAVSDNGAGDDYGFAVRAGRCAPEVLVLDHETGTLEPTAHTDSLEFLVADLRRHL